MFVGCEDFEEEEFAVFLARTLPHFAKTFDVQAALQENVVLDIAEKVGAELRALCARLSDDEGNHQGVALTKQIALIAYWTARMRPFANVGTVDGGSASYCLNELVALFLGIQLLADAISEGKITRVRQTKLGRCLGRCAQNDCVGRYASLYFTAGEPLVPESDNDDVPGIVVRLETTPRNLQYTLVGLVNGDLTPHSLAVMFDHILYAACIGYEPLVDELDYSAAV